MLAGLFMELRLLGAIRKAPEAFGTVIWDKLEATFGLKSVQLTLYLTMHMLIANKWCVSCTVSENCKQNKKNGKNFIKKNNQKH